MPPAIKITRDIIINQALEIIKVKGIGELNARNLAKELNCSVQPIYYQFKNMKDLKSELVNQVYKQYKEYVYESKKSKAPYLSAGISYIKFAKERRNFFNLLFINTLEDSVEDPTLDYVYELVAKKTELSVESIKDFHFNMWVYVHGLATMVYTGLIDYNEQKIEELLKNQYSTMIRRYKNV